MIKTTNSMTPGTSKWKLWYQLRRKNAKKKVVFIPKTIKFKRLRKATLSNIQYKKTACNLVYGAYGVKILKNGRLTIKQLESVRKKIAPFIKKTDKLWFRGRTDYPLTSKEKGMRMGKGKGAVKYWVWRIKSGDIIFELSPMSLWKAKKIIFLAVKKLPLPATLVYQNKKL